MELRIRLALIGWFIDQLVRAKGEKYTLLPISHRWDRTPRSLAYLPNRIAGNRLASMNNFANKVASRKWEHALRVTVPWGDAGDIDRTRLNVFDVGFKPYIWNDPDVTLRRTALGLRILEEIEELGEMCCHMHRQGRGTHCVCTVLTQHPGNHEGRHRSDTCTW